VKKSKTQEKRKKETTKKHKKIVENVATESKEVIQRYCMKEKT
jgi:hypothetical protein